MSGLQELVSSAFGSNVCLYKDVLKCSSKATPSELRKHYHKQALLYHPDKHQESSEARVKEATLKFQALSAAYQLLSDQSQRALYDTTGRIPESVDENDDDDPSGATSRRRSSSGRAHMNKNTDEWVRFFQSVFQDVINAGSKFDRQEYCGSQQEREDVLKYYQLCKGDKSKMMSCIVQSEEEDLERWWKDIIQPAIEKGGIENYETTGASCVDMDETSTKKKKRKKLVRKRKRSVAKAPTQPEEDSLAANGLEDTDDEDIKESGSIQKAKTKMSRKEKMEFRVAKKRKEKKEREIEIAEIVQSKQWTASSVFGKASDGKRGRSKRRNQHGLSESFLSGLQEKFSNSECVQGGKKKTKKLKRR